MRDAKLQASNLKLQGNGKHQAPKAGVRLPVLEA
jgi:hypothetical protein